MFERRDFNDTMFLFLWSTQSTHFALNPSLYNLRCGTRVSAGFDKHRKRCHSHVWSPRKHAQTYYANTRCWRRSRNSTITRFETPTLKPGRDLISIDLANCNHWQLSDYSYSSHHHHQHHHNHHVPPPHHHHHHHVPPPPPHHHHHFPHFQCNV